MNRPIAVPIAVAVALALVLIATAAPPPQGAMSPLWQRSIAPNADSAPAYASRVALSGGRHAAVVYTLAGNNQADCSPGDPVRAATLYAFNATTGARLWSRSTAGPSRCTTAGPVVDPSGAWVYAAGLDGRVHRYAAGTGAEYRRQGWPKRITTMPQVEKISAQLTIGFGRLYATTSGFIGDQGHYEGHLVAIALRTGRTTVFNTLCSDIRRLLRASDCPSVQSGLFGRGQGEVDPATRSVWIVSGNGPWNGRTNWGDSVLKLNPAGTRLLDAFTPANQQQLADGDLDLGSTTPALLPTIRQGTRTYRLLVQGGKGPACDGCDGVALWLLNRDNLSGRGGPGYLGGALQYVNAPGGCQVLTAPAVWRVKGQIWVFYANDCGTAGYRLISPAAGTFRLRRVWADGTGGTTPVLHGGRLFVARDGAILARDPRTGRVLTQAKMGGVHWEYPAVVHGRLFISDEDGHLSAYRIPW